MTRFVLIGLPTGFGLCIFVRVKELDFVADLALGIAISL